MQGKQHRPTTQFSSSPLVTVTARTELYSLPMLLYRLIKREFFMTEEFRKYLWYVLGEILLVVVGIFIALQIDTWYQDKQTQSRLDDYLLDISQDIQSDLQRLEEVKVARTDTIFESFSAFLGTTRPGDDPAEWYNAAFTRATSRAIEKAQSKRTFTASTGSYRALESSGLSPELSDTSLLSLLYDYYRSADKIVQLEEDLNELIAQLTLRYQIEATRDIPQIIVREPLMLWSSLDTNDNEHRNATREAYWSALTHPVTQSLLRVNISQSIMREYEQLSTLGHAIVERIGSQEDIVPAGRGMNVDSDAGYPILIQNGRPEYHSYGYFTAPAESFGWDMVYNRVWIDDSALHVSYPGNMPWAYFYVKVGTIDIVFERYTADYSIYDRLHLEMKRDEHTVCSGLQLEVKDREGAFKSGLQSVPLELTPEWSSRTVALAEFVDADLTSLNVVAGFLYSSMAPCLISIRNVRYLRPDE